MQVHEFFSTYANTPLSDRFKILDINKYGLMTLSEVYQRIHAIEDKLRPDVIERDRLIRIADEYYERTRKQNEQG